MGRFAVPFGIIGVQATVVAVVTCATMARVDADEELAVAFFESRIRPVLVEHCHECHSATSATLKGGLRLDSRRSLLVGGDSGPAIDLNRPEESLLVAALRYDGIEMPPAGRLPDRVVDDVVTWIRMGAVDPRPDPGVVAAPVASVDVEAGRSFWSFQPISAPSVPHVRNTAWPATDSDRFILARLEAVGLDPGPDADRATWLRRVTFDLIGLPPTPDEIEAFGADSSPTAREHVVDRLLASPQFGERWARHWLDLARFAESSGGGRSMVFPEAWRYRDWVIDACNNDMPVDEFIVRQLAGDLLPAESPAEEAANLIATGYLVLGATNYEEQDKKLLEMDVVDEQLDTLGKGLLGMTLGCARCHDHKFDPVPTSDYYALAGILRSTDMLIHENVSRWKERPLPLDAATTTAVAAHATDLAAAQSRLAAAQQALAEVDPAAAGGSAVIPASAVAGIALDDSRAKRVGEWIISQHVKRYIGEGYLHDGNVGKGTKTLTFQPEFPGPGIYEVRLAYTANDNRASNVPVSLLTFDGEADLIVDMRKPPPLESRFVSLGTYRFDSSNQWFVMVSNDGTDGYVVVDAVQFLPVDRAAVVADKEDTPRAEQANATAAARAAVERLEKEFKTVAKRAPRVPRAMAVEDAESPIDLPIMIRGNVHNSGPVVRRGVLRVATHGTPPLMPSDSSGRLELARWIASADNPLTARVWINRVWSKLFGTGIVRTVDNFGSTGELPSHPHLLDFLASRFMADGWRTKTLIRSLVLSRTYRLAVGNSDTDLSVDPENRLLARMNRRRIDAESLRDAILQVSGTLDSTMGGPSIADPNVLGGAGSDRPTEYGYRFIDTRRSIYTPAFRNRRLELFETFDGADPNAVAGSRTVSTVAPQALYLLNSPFVMEQANAAATHILADDRRDDAARLDAAFLAALGRRPRPGEREAVLASLATAGDDRLAGWQRIFQALYGCIDFRTLE
ncbi:MAG: DUF1553 domain-containing protein [Planctomycetota bacterium]|nr:DUF1553 domain-containing protein [Planctomycetota bacterium]